MNRFLKTVLPILGVVLFAACNRHASTPPAERLTLGVVPKGSTLEFWKAVHAGALKAGRDLEVEILWKGPVREDDLAAQIAVVEAFVARGVNGLLLAPLDDRALRAPVSNAVHAGIPVVIFDSDLQSDLAASFVATDNREAGRKAGDALARLLDGRGRAALLRYAAGSASTAEREAGFLEAIARYPEIQVVSADRHGGASVASAREAALALLAAFTPPDGRLGIDGLFCPNESTSSGMLQALRETGRAGKVRFVGFDSVPDLVDALDQGHCDALLLQDPVNIGYQGVKTLVQHLRGQSVPARLDTGSTLVTRDNRRDPAVQSRLAPEQVTPDEAPEAAR